MISDEESKLAVSRCPHIRCRLCVHKIEDLIRERIAFEADLCGDYAVIGGGVIDMTVCNRGELRAVFCIEDNVIYRVRELRRTDSVQHDVADGNLALKRLRVALRIYNSREPEKVAAVIKAVAGGDRFSGILYIDGIVRAVPSDLRFKCFCN